MVQVSNTAAMNFDDAFGPPAALNGDEAEKPVQEEGADADAAVSMSGAPLTPKNRNCPICHLSFRRNEHLERHVRMHTMEKPFVCVVCETRFSRK